jgi:hypothetical protein
MKDFIVIKKGRQSQQASVQVRIKLAKAQVIIYFYNGAASKISNTGYILMKYSCDENRLYFECSSNKANAYKISEPQTKNLLDGVVKTNSKILEWELLEGVYTLEYDSTEQLYYIQFDVEASRILNNREI